MLSADLLLLMDLGQSISPVSGLSYSYSWEINSVVVSLEGAAAEAHWHSDLRFRLHGSTCRGPGAMLALSSGSLFSPSFKSGIPTISPFLSHLSMYNLSYLSSYLSTYHLSDLFIYLSICPSIPLSIRLSVHPSYLSLYHLSNLSINPFICLFHPSVHPSYLSIHLAIQKAYLFSLWESSSLPWVVRGSQQAFGGTVSPLEWGHSSPWPLNNPRSCVAPLCLPPIRITFTWFHFLLPNLIKHGGAHQAPLECLLGLYVEPSPHPTMWVRCVLICL